MPPTVAPTSLGVERSATKDKEEARNRTVTMAISRTFACKRYLSFSIRDHSFVGRRLTTDDTDVIALIECCDGYGVYIHPVETKEELEAMGYGEKAPPEESVEEENAEPQEE